MTRIQDTSPRAQYTAMQNQTVFPFLFWVPAAEDLSVYIEDTLQTLDIDYTVSGVLDENGGLITFLTPPLEGQTVTLERNMPLERTTQFQEAGAFKASVLNLELSKIIAMVQQLKRDVDRKVGLQATSTISSAAALMLPNPEDGKTLVFDGVSGVLRTSEINLNDVDNTITQTQIAATEAAQAVIATQAAQAATESARDEAVANIGQVKAVNTDTTPKPLTDKLNVTTGLHKTTQSIDGDAYVELGVALSSQSDAEMGADNTTVMTPLRVKQQLAAHAFSVGQVWIDETANRALGGTYQNTTGKAIFVAMDISDNNNSNPSEYYLEVSTDESTWTPICAGDVGNFNHSAGCSGIVPHGSYYRYRKFSGPNTVTALAFWSELK